MSTLVTRKGGCWRAQRAACLAFALTTPTHSRGSRGALWQELQCQGRALSMCGCPAGLGDLGGFTGIAGGAPCTRSPSSHARPAIGSEPRMPIFILGPEAQGEPGHSRGDRPPG